MGLIGSKEKSGVTNNVVAIRPNAKTCSSELSSLFFTLQGYSLCP